MFTALVVNLGFEEGTVVRRALEAAGCEAVVAAPTGASPVSPLHGRSPDLVVTHVASDDPRELQRVQRLARALRDTPVLAICDEMIIEAALRSGATDAICTPLRWGELVARVRGALRGKAEQHRRRTREIRTHETLERLKSEKHQLERLVSVDALTGIANRRHALALLDAEWRRAQRAHGMIAVVMLDLDFFHAYNEQYGHLGGDACLRQVAEAMVTCLQRPSDFLGRYGGEEFIAVLPGTDAAGARLVAERLRAAVAALAIPHAGSQCAPHVTVTAGFGAIDVTAELTPEVLIAEADAALLRAKAAGRDRVEGDAPAARELAPVEGRPRFAPVHADPWLADRIPPFLAEIRAEARALEIALKDGRHDRVRAVVRRLRSVGHALGLAEIERRGEALERDLRAHDEAAACATLAGLLDYAANVQVVYRSGGDTPLRAVT